MKSLHYRHSDNTRFLWQGLESGKEDIAQQAEQSAEKDKACTNFSSELGDLAGQCIISGKMDLYQKHLELQRQQADLESGLPFDDGSKAGSYDGVNGRPSIHVDEDF